MSQTELFWSASTLCSSSCGLSLIGHPGLNLGLILSPLSVLLCSRVRPYHLWLLSLSPFQPLLSYFRHVSSQMALHSRVLSDPSPSNQSVLFSTVIKTKTTQQNTWLHPRAAYSSFDCFRRLESFLYTVDTFFYRSQLPIVVLH